MTILVRFKLNVVGETSKSVGGKKLLHIIEASCPAEVKGTQTLHWQRVEGVLPFVVCLHHGGDGLWILLVLRVLTIESKWALSSGAIAMTTRSWSTNGISSVRRCDIMVDRVHAILDDDTPTGRTTSP